MADGRCHDGSCLMPHAPWLQREMEQFDGTSPFVTLGEDQLRAKLDLSRLDDLQYIKDEVGSRATQCSSRAIQQPRSAAALDTAPHWLLFSCLPTPFFLSSTHPSVFSYGPPPPPRGG